MTWYGKKRNLEEKKDGCKVWWLQRRWGNGWRKWRVMMLTMMVTEMIMAFAWDSFAVVERNENQDGGEDGGCFCMMFFSVLIKKQWFNLSENCVWLFIFATNQWNWCQIVSLNSCDLRVGKGHGRTEPAHGTVEQNIREYSVLQFHDAGYFLPRPSPVVKSDFCKL